MITLTIVEQVKIKNRVNYTRKMKLFHSMDKARAYIQPVVKEMKLAKSQKRQPSIRIDGVSYDTKSEKTLLLELDAIVSVENENNDY